MGIGSGGQVIARDVDANRSVAANTKAANVFQGTTYERAPTDGNVRVNSSASATGLRITIAVSGVVVMNDQGVSQSNHFPIYPDDLVVETPVGEGELVQIDLRNTTGGAITVETVREYVG
jgi:hypothetical protein